MPRPEEANLPATNEGYGTREYCEGPDHNFDWFLNADYLLPIFEELTADFGKDTRILMLGCGNSQLSEAMYDAGWKNIVNIDFSTALIEQMKVRHEGRPGMEWLEMDIMDLKFGEEFDLVVDKGTMDALLTSKGDPWNPPEKDIVNCTKEVDEAVRVLKKRPGSKFVYFTFGQPHFRKRYLINRESWKFSQRTIGPPEGFDYFQYLLEWEPAA
ncbi:hypothetical protein Q8F55_007939 [Vanrija albida]|uniref:Methyltransferase domain-containing protein n=1 Tax=Vanrija albida TaxID=181172 RepID=A0ABR3PUW3_9TREE